MIYETKNMEGNALQVWIRKAPEGYLERLAEGAKTSPGYLRVLAGGHRENPKVRLCRGLVTGCRLLNPEVKEKYDIDLPEITFDNLANIGK